MLFADFTCERSARLLASVPPESRSTSRGSIPARSATACLAASTWRRACAPCPWVDEGLPQASAMAAASAVTTSGKGGVVAFQSR